MRQNLGQHFLKNSTALKRIAAALEISADDTIIEIGPGHGELTAEIVSVAQKSGGVKVIALERDPELAKEVTARFGSTVHVEEGNALALLPQVVPVGNYKIAGNIPYYLTGYLLRIISGLPHKPRLAVLTIQKEVAERLVAEPPQMNRLAAAVQFWAEPKIIGFIPRHDFAPPPEVDSAIVALKTRSELLPSEKTDAYYKILAAIFKQPRKTIENNLTAGLGINRTDVQIKLQEMGIRANLRPQNLKVSDISRIAAGFG